MTISSRPARPIIALLGMTFGLMLTFFAAPYSAKAEDAPAFTPAAEELFKPSLTDDWALKWIDHLLGPDNTDLVFANGDNGTTTVSGAGLTTVLKTLLRIYSIAMLVVGGIILTYHLIVITTEGAWKGQMGGRANQIWAPIRVVFAIGLLVPLGSGINTGQEVVLQFARWGSNLGSYAWTKTLTYMLNMDSGVVVSTKFNMSVPAAQFVMTGICTRVIENNRMCVAEKSLKDNGYNVIGYAAGDKVLVAGNECSTDLLSNQKCGALRLASAGGDSTGILNPAIEDLLRTRQNGLFVAQSDVFRKYGFDAADGILKGSLIGEPPGYEDDVTSFNNQLSALTKEIVGGKTIKDLINPKNPLYILSQSTGDGSSASGNHGWVLAGMYYVIISRVYSEMSSALAALPQVAIPEIKGVLPNNHIREGEIQKIIDGATVAFGNALQGARKSAEDAKGEDGELDQVMRYVRGLMTLYGILDSEGDLILTTANFTQNPGDAIGSMISLGNRLLRASLSMMGSAVMTSTILDTGALFLKKATTNPALNFLATGIDKFTDIVVAFAIAIGFILFVAALTLAFILPMMPFFRFFLGVMTWLISVVEAVVAIPLVALAHLNPYGDDLPASSARPAYMMLLQLLFRPFLMLVGMILAIVLANSMIAFLNATFWSALAVIDSTTSGGAAISTTQGALSQLIYLIIYCIMAYSIVTMCMKLIDILPTNALKWIGASPVGEGGRVDDSFIGAAAGAVTTYVAGGMVKDVVTQSGNIVSGSVSGIYDARKAKKDENDAIEAAYRERGMFELIKRNNPDVTGADLVDIGRKSYEAQSANASKASTSGQSTNSQQAADAQQQAQQAEQKANQALQALKRGDSKPKPRDASAKRSTGSRLNRLMDMLTAFFSRKPPGGLSGS
ncbi:MAG: DotA/TraY family protein [Alphaproteobacteria bacterium]|nr:MAG: DotA/TraY family protein [Alphaproteobacteria bacterium]